jgi:hypothetical protein
VDVSREKPWRDRRKKLSSGFRPGVAAAQKSNAQSRAKVPEGAKVGKMIRKGLQLVLDEKAY